MTCHTKVYIEVKYTYLSSSSPQPLEQIQVRHLVCSNPKSGKQPASLAQRSISNNQPWQAWLQRVVRCVLEIWVLLFQNYWIGLFHKSLRYIPVIVVSSLMVVFCFTSSHPRTESMNSKLNDIKNELDNWSWLYEHYWSCMILMINDHSWSLIMLIMYEICWSCYDTLLIMHDICWSCYERLLIMHEICWSCYERLLIIHDDQWSLPWKTVDHSWSTLIGVSYRDHYSWVTTLCILQMCLQR